MIRPRIDRSLIFIVLLGATFCITGCVSKYFVLDTTSDTVYEYKNDFYVSKIDTVIEMHYQFWSRDAALWLSVYNNMGENLFLIVDSTYIEHNGQKQKFDHYVDWSEYSRQFSAISELEQYDLNRVLPIIPGFWKSMLSDPLKFDISEWEAYDPNSVWDKEDSPCVITVQTCFYRQSYAVTPICNRDTIWVQTFAPVDAQQLRQLEYKSSYLKADKFYISNSFN